MVTDKISDDAQGLPWLVADIGGTNARFGWVDRRGGPVGHVRQLAVAEHATLQHAATVYLAELAQTQGPAFQAPRRAALAVATVTDADEIAFTNSPWRFSREALRQALRLDGLTILNDFEALAWSLPRLTPAQLRPHAGLPSAQGCLAVIGPGTGLGVAGLVQTLHGWQALPGEGGHATLAPSNDFESRVLAEARCQWPHVSAERLLSGTGLPTLHAAVAAALDVPADSLDAATVVERGLARSDVVCDQVLDTFCALLGGFAGNVALTLGARGGVFIGGGIVPRLGERFFSSRFRECFEAKGRFQPYLAAIPTAVITDTQAALMGAAAALERDSR